MCWCHGLSFWFSYFLFYSGRCILMCHVLLSTSCVCIFFPPYLIVLFVSTSVFVLLAVLCFSSAPWFCLISVLSCVSFLCPRAFMVSTKFVFLVLLDCCVPSCVWVVCCLTLTVGRCVFAF